MIGTEIGGRSVAFVFNGGSENVGPHAAHHPGLLNGWTNRDGTSQKFLQDGVCASMHQQSASGSLVQVPGRYHMRYRTSASFGGLLGWYSVADAHHEFVALCPILPKHAVDHNDDNNGRSGFDMGRDDIRANWVGNGHTLVDQQYWGNRQPFKQCDNRYSWSDGTAYLISIN